MTKIITFTCPVCGGPPIMAIGETMFCGGDDCNVLFWDGTKTKEECLADQKTVRLDNVAGD